MYGENTRSTSTYTTPLAAPPPPLHLLSAQQGRGTHNMHLPAYAGARHTLGPMFNDEEDGDDSAFIAQQMNLLGLNEAQAGGRNQNGQRRRNTTTSGPNNSNHRNNRRQARSQTQEPEYEFDQSQQAAAYLALQAQAQQALLAAQFQSAGIDHQTQQALAQRYQMQLQLAALQLQQQQHQQQQQQQNRQPQRRPSPNPPYNQSQQYHGSAYASASDQRNQLAAQVQANLLARTRRQKNLDDAETRARFEAAPNVNKDQTSPVHSGHQSPFAPKTTRPGLRDDVWGSGPANTFSPETSPASFAPRNTTENLWRTESPKTSTSAFASRFGTRAQAGSQLSSDHSSSDGLFHHTRSSAEDAASTDTDLSLSHADTTAQTSPKSTESEFDNDDKPATKFATSGLGLGRPARAWSTPASSGSPPATGNAVQPRSTSYTAGAGAGAAVNVLRQPFGPPGNIEKLKEENFKTLLRKRAGAGLHMLNRRASPNAHLLSLE